MKLALETFIVLFFSVPVLLIFLTGLCFSLITLFASVRTLFF